MDSEGLFLRLQEGDLTLEPLRERHRAGLAAACAADTEIWAIYPRDWSSDGFNASFDALLGNVRARPFAILLDGRVVGMTSFLDADSVPGVVEIGGSYIAPDVRGSGLNTRVKRLMIARAGACGFHRVELRIDTRNARSMAAAEKIGATLEGVLRRHRRTWTGYLRDTAVFAIFPAESPAG